MASDNELTKGFQGLHLEEDYVMVVAIDFGTTYSGYSFSFKSTPEEIRCNKEWGNEVGIKTYKTPTCVLTVTNPRDRLEAFGYEAMNIYCRELEADVKYHLYDRFKMSLYKEKVVGTKTTIVSRGGRSLPAETVISMSLQYMKEHIVSALQHAEVGEVDIDRIRWVLTVPAIWSEGSKQLMRRAACTAGIIPNVHSKRLLIALEPEAASFWCRSLPLNQFEGSETAEKYMSEGSTYMIVDCGGGTVDLTVHEILLGGDIKEVHRANGGDWGGTTVDNGFLNVLDEIFGVQFTSTYKRRFPQDWFNMLINFETLKRSFKPGDNKSMNVSLSYNLGEEVMDELGKSLKKVVTDAQLKGVSFSHGMLVLQPRRIEMIYNPVISAIVEHVDDLLTNDIVKAVQYIFLVGGFSESKMLSTAIVERFGGERKVLIPQDSGVCVMKGASLFGHNPSAIKSRIARCTYGVEISPQFDEQVHDPDKKIVVDDEVRVANVFNVWVKKGESINVGERKTFTYRPYSMQADNIAFNIYNSDREDVKYVTDEGVHIVGNMSLATPDVHLPVAKRTVEAEIYFGGTEIFVRAKDTSREDGDVSEISIDFLSE